MSATATTTTTTTTTTRSLSVLADYEVHHSGAEHTGSAVPVNPEQPADWPTHYRRMPTYRPANSRLDQADRPAGNGHPAEYAFIQIMLHGVWLNAVCQKSTIEQGFRGMRELTTDSLCLDYGGLPVEGSTTRSSITKWAENGSALRMGLHGYCLFLLYSESCSISHLSNPFLDRS
jgi:hypothetical protein